MTGLEITLLAKEGGPLTKQITLGEDGMPRSDGSACRMAHGEAKRLHLSGVAELAAVIDANQIAHFPAKPRRAPVADGRL